MKTQSTEQQPGATALSYVGLVSAHPKGFGFVTTTEGDEYFIPSALMRTLIPGDLVQFTIDTVGKTGKIQVSGATLVERKASAWLGVVIYDNGHWRLEPDEPCFVKLHIGNVGYIAPGQVVCVRVPGKGPMTDTCAVSLERVLGERTRKGFDADYALARFDFTPGFSPSALSQASKLTSGLDTFELMKPDRVDLRAIPFVTIDGESTRDFDDAVFAKRTPSGFQVMVAIADVSHYVRPGSALDRDARRRATSVYLPGKTVPMLPEALSNGLCSLLPGHDRLTVVARIELDAAGIVLKTEFFKAIIQSFARMTYEQVTAILEQCAPTLGASDVRENLDVLLQVYKLMDGHRKARGVMEFLDAEPKLATREDGELELTWEHRTVAHKLVEELMLLANRSVARLTQELHGQGLFRHQPMPTEEDWAELGLWCVGRGLTLAEKPSLLAMSELIHSVESGDAPVVELRVRKVMQQAIYDTRNPAHFSLGFDSYAHFTSPIRRYSDLVVHRLLLKQISVDEALRETAALCSERARAARLAERQVWDRLKKRMMARDVRKDFPLEAKIVAMGRRGVRVVVEAWQCAVLLPAQNLMKEGYSFDSDTQAWQLEKKALEPGRRLTVRWTTLEEDRGRTELLAEIVQV